MNNERKFIISTNYGGMCNRLKGWLSVLRMAISSEKTPKLYWPKNDLCGCNFSDLFLNKPLEVNGIQGYLKNENYELIDTWRLLLLPSDKIKEGFAKVYPIKGGDGKSIDFEYDRIPQKIRESILVYINSLVPKEEIMEKVKDFSRKNNFNELIGVHIRRGDFNVLNDGRGRISTDRDFFKRMDELIKEESDIRFFLTTDDEDVEKRYIDRYRDKIVVCSRVNKKRERDSVLATQEALIDLLLLSRSKHILGTYLSSFTELAWWFSNCKAKIEIVGDYKIKEKEKVIKKLHGRGFVCVTKFWNGLVRKVKQN